MSRYPVGLLLDPPTQQQNICQAGACSCNWAGRAGPSTILGCSDKCFQDVLSLFCPFSMHNKRQKESHANTPFRDQKTRPKVGSKLPLSKRSTVRVSKQVFSDCSVSILPNNAQWAVYGLRNMETAHSVACRVHVVRFAECSPHCVTCSLCILRNEHGAKYRVQSVHCAMCNVRSVHCAKRGVPSTRSAEFTVCSVQCAVCCVRTA